MCLIWQHLVVTVQAADVSVATSTVVLVKIEERPVFLLFVCSGLLWNHFASVSIQNIRLLRAKEPKLALCYAIKSTSVSV